MDKQEKSVVSKLNAESEFKAMANATSELVWIRDLHGRASDYNSYAHVVILRQQSNDTYCRESCLR